MITHLEPDILECEVKWALESITMNKASGSDGILVELFQILEDAALNMSANLENSAAATGLEKVSFLKDIHLFFIYFVVSGAHRMVNLLRSMLDL